MSLKVVDGYRLIIRFVGMIMCAFGQTMVDYVINLCHGHVDYLQRLPDNVIQRILQFVDLEDIARVSLLNKKFHQVIHTPFMGDIDELQVHAQTVKSGTPILSYIYVKVYSSFIQAVMEYRRSNKYSVVLKVTIYLRPSN